MNTFYFKIRTTSEIQPRIENNLAMRKDCDLSHLLVWEKSLILILKHRKEQRSKINFATDCIKIYSLLWESKTEKAVEILQSFVLTWFPKRVLRLQRQLWVIIEIIRVLLNVKGLFQKSCLIIVLEALSIMWQWKRKLWRLAVDCTAEIKRRERKYCIRVLQGNCTSIKFIWLNNFV